MLHYRGDVDYFGVYCPDNDKTYLIPIDGLGLTAASLRVEPPKNGQIANIRLAADYEI